MRKPEAIGGTGILLAALLCWVVSVGEAQEPPEITGELAEQIGPADVSAMRVLAQGLVSVPLGKPMLIKTEASSARDKPAKLWRAVIYFTPREHTPTVWRGFLLECYREDSLYPQDEQNQRRVVAKWSGPVGNKIGEYLVRTRGAENLPDFPNDQLAHFHYIRLGSDLETRCLLEMIDTAQGYSRILADGSELPFRDLGLLGVHTQRDKDGRMVGTVDVSCPREKLRWHFPFHVHLQSSKNGDWRIASVDQYVY